MDKAQGGKDIGQCRAGTTVLEFTMLVPVFLLFLFAVLGTGLNGFYQLTLDDAVRNAARQLQIDGPAGSSGAQFAAAVCSQMGRLMGNCTGNLTYNVQSNTPPANFASLTPVALPSSGKLANQFPSSLTDNSNVLVQVACPLPFSMPFIGKAITFTGSNAILATTTVRVEPF